LKYQMSDLWNFFDGFYMITTESSKRRKGLERNLKNVGIKNCQSWFANGNQVSNNGIEDPINPPGWVESAMNLADTDFARDLANNHMGIIDKAYEAGLKNIIIFEDDARFQLPLDIAKLQKIVKWLQSNHWDVFYFGWIPWPVIWSWFKTPGVVEIATPQTAHCYALSRKGMRRVRHLRKTADIVPIDRFYAMSNMEMYGAFPAMSFQSEDPAIYRRLCPSFLMSFETVSRMFEFVSVGIPPLFITLMTVLIVSGYWQLIRKPNGALS
jgi:hypothetical protein